MPRELDDLARPLGDRLRGVHDGVGRATSVSARSISPSTRSVILPSTPTRRSTSTIRASRRAGSDAPIATTSPPPDQGRAPGVDDLLGRRHGQRTQSQQRHTPSVPALTRPSKRYRSGASPRARATGASVYAATDCASVIPPRGRPPRTRPATARPCACRPRCPRARARRGRGRWRGTRGRAARTCRGRRRADRGRSSEPARRPVSSRSSRAARTSGGIVGAVGRGALRELPAPQAQGVAVLLDQGELVAVEGDDEGVVGLVDHAVEAVGAVGSRGRCPRAPPSTGWRRLAAARGSAPPDDPRRVRCDAGRAAAARRLLLYPPCASSSPAARWTTPAG